MSKDSSSEQRISKRQRIKKVFGFLSSGKSSSISEEELKGLLSEAPELQSDEKRMIGEIFELTDMTAREIMQPRVDMIIVEDTESGRAALERMRGTGYSRLPVYHEDIDDVVGIVHYKDLIGPLMDGKIDEPVTKFMYDPMFVPETKNVLTLLSELQEKRRQMAIVVDEYGGIDGLLTVEDILEEIVGDIIDETDFDREMLTFIGPGAWRVEGSFPLENAFELGWIKEEDKDFETLAGWLMDKTEEVPITGEEFVIDGYRYKIERMRRNRVQTMKVTKEE